MNCYLCHLGPATRRHRGNDLCDVCADYWEWCDSASRAERRREEEAIARYVDEAHEW